MPILSAELVVDLRKHSNVKDAERALYLAFRRLKRRARRYFGRFEYLTFVEISQRGWPRLLLLARGADVPRKWLSENWTECGGARISNVRWLRSLRNVIDAMQPFRFAPRRQRSEGRRKVRFSAGFFQNLFQDLAITGDDLAYWSAYQTKWAVSYLFGGGSKYGWPWLLVLALRAAQERAVGEETGN